MFLNIGVKGADKSIGAISGVSKSLGDVSSMSLEAKAGIIGALYATEQLFAQSGKAGTGLTNFNAAFGLSIQTLQKYQYAARQVGMSNEEVEGSFKGLQQAVTKQLMGQGNIAGLARVGINAKDLQEYARQPEMLLQKLQEYAGRETNIGFRNEILKSFGLGEGMIAALSRKAFRPEALAHAPGYSDREAKNLDRANIAWSNLGNKIQMAVGHFNSAHGGKLVSDISKLVDKAVLLVNQFVKLSDQLGAFKIIGTIFEGWAKLLGLVANSVKEVNEYIHPKKEEGKESNPSLISRVLGDSVDALKSIGDRTLQAAAGLTVSNQPTAFGFVGSPITPQTISPNVNATPTQNIQTQNLHVNQTLNFQHAGTNPSQTANSIKKAVHDASRQLDWGWQG